jgi:hypothetical protein
LGKSLWVVINFTQLGPGLRRGTSECVTEGSVLSRPADLFADPDLEQRRPVFTGHEQPVVRGVIGDAVGHRVGIGIVDFGE